MHYQRAYTCKEISLQVYEQLSKVGGQVGLQKAGHIHGVDRVVYHFSDQSGDRVRHFTLQTSIGRNIYRGNLSIIC